MSPQDAGFLFAEGEDNPLHIALVAIFEGPVPEGGEVTRRVEAKLDRIPRYRQKVQFVPFQLGAPVWVDDARFDIHYHVRRTALPSPGSTERLDMLVGRLVSQRLDLERSPWELWVVEGLAEDRWALVSKVHHCMVDGIAGVGLMSVLLDDAPDAPLAQTRPWTPRRPPSTVSLVTDAMWTSATRPIEGLRTLGRIASTPRRALRSLADFGDGLASFRAFREQEVEATLNGPVGPHRRWSHAAFAMADVKAIRERWGGTVNDVALAAVTLGVRRLLQSRGGEPGARSVRAGMPVSLRREDQQGVLDNRVAVVMVELPVEQEDPVECLRAVTAETHRVKEDHQVDAMEVLNALVGRSPVALYAAAAHAFAETEQHAVQLIATNVPGPREPLYVAGRRMLEAHPYVPLAGGVRIGIAIFSYAGRISFGISADYESVADLDVLVAAIEAGFASLSKAR